MSQSECPKSPPLVLNTDAETFTALVNGVVDCKALLYTSPRVNQTVLQIVLIVGLCLANSVLHRPRPCSRSG